MKVCEPLLTMSEFCRRISPVGGKPIDPSTGWRWSKQGRLRIVRAGRRILVPESAVGEFLERETAEWRERQGLPSEPRPRTPDQRARAAQAAARRIGVELEDAG